MNALRNPVLELPSAAKLETLPPEAKAALAAVLADLAVEANAAAELAWSKKKGPMAAYWRAVSTYAKHLGRAVRRPDRRPGWQGRALHHSARRRSPVLRAFDSWKLEDGITLRDAIARAEGDPR